MFTWATLSLAALERFVNTDPDLEPDELVAIAVDIEPDVAIEAVDVADFAVQLANVSATTGPSDDR